MLEREVFLMKPKHRYHLSQWGECFCGAQSWKEMRLLCVFMIAQIDKQILIPKMVEIEVSLMKPKHKHLLP